MHPKAYWVGFNFVKGIGAVRLQKLLKLFDGDLKAAWEAPLERFMAAGINQPILDHFLSLRKKIDLEQVWDRLEKTGIQVITWDDPNYPRLLREIDQSPPVLYVRGELIPEDDVAVAIVGTRRVSAYGRQVTEDLATYLSQHRITIVSGLARGIDAIAHQATLRAGGRTIAVLGSGVDRIYPPENRHLAEEMMASGALLSDYPPGTPPESSNFPPRNRIISGLSLAIVVIEAGDTSGALITASYAADQGRDVLAVPGNINSPNSRGTNRLIQSGAKPLLSPQDVLETMNIDQITTHRMARKILPTDETETKLLDVLSTGTMAVDEISFLSGLPIEKVSATLAMLELKGLVRNAGGMNFLAV